RKKEALLVPRCGLATRPEGTIWEIHNRLTSSGLGSPIIPGREVPTVFTVREDKDQAPNKAPTSDFSSFNSFTLPSVFPRLNSLIGTPVTTSTFPLFTRVGKDAIKFFSTP